MELLPTGLTKLLFNVTIGTLLGKNLLIKSYVFLQFRAVSVSFSVFSGRFFIRFAKVHSFHLSIRTILGKNFQKFCTSSSIFESWTIFFGLSPKLFQGLSKLHSTCAEEHVGGKFVILKELEFRIIFGQWVNISPPSRKIIL